MQTKQLIVKPEISPRLILKRDLKESRLFSLNFHPALGLLSPKANLLVLITKSFEYFNESSLELANSVSPGDMIDVYCQTSEFYDYKLPEELELQGTEYTNLFIVKEVLDGPYESKVIIGELAI